MRLIGACSQRIIESSGRIVTGMIQRNRPPESLVRMYEKTSAIGDRADDGKMMDVVEEEQEANQKRQKARPCQKAASIRDLALGCNHGSK